MTRRRVTTASRHNSDQDVKGVGKIIERNWSGLMTDAILAGVPGTKQERTRRRRDRDRQRDADGNGDGL